jgi:hypothetical protein
MKAIRSIWIIALLLFVLGCERDTDLQEFNFVRFGLTVNSDGFPLEYPQVRTNLQEVETFTHANFTPLKIPVVLSSSLSNSPTEVYYTATTEGSYSGYTFSSINKVVIPAGKLVDTLTVAFNSVWSSSDVGVSKLKLQITGTSRENVTVGYPNSIKTNKTLTIALGALDKKYSLEQTLYAIQGNINEEIPIKVKFNAPIDNATQNGFDFLSEEFISISPCEPNVNSFAYTITQEPYTGLVYEITYKLKLLQTVSAETNLKITLNSGLPDWQITNITQANVRKLQDTQNRVGDPAAFWYNVADANHRTFGKAWYLNSSSNSCDWSNFFAFTKPLSVPIGSEFDNGQGRHRFKIGFNTSSTTNTTNPFDFRRFYQGASVASSGFNIAEAIEFFPTTANTGTLKIIPQTLIIVKNSNNQPFAIPICGSGSYSFDNVNNRYIMYVEVVCDETSVNGNNNVIKRMYIYSNNNGYVDPPALTLSCSPRINL